MHVMFYRCLILQFNAKLSSPWNGPTVRNGCISVSRSKHHQGQEIGECGSHNTEIVMSR